MAAPEIHRFEKPPGERRQLDCVEIYLPKSIAFLSELYQMLREKVTQRMGKIVLDGFSIYEVDGVFHGEQFWEQRTLVIRLLIIRNPVRPRDYVAGLIGDLGREIAIKVAQQEEEIWICYYPQEVTVFTGLKRLLP